MTPSRAEAAPFLEELRSIFLPNRVLAVNDGTVTRFKQHSNWSRKVR